jgi:hypothetical protein
MSNGMNYRFIPFNPGFRAPQKQRQGKTALGTSTTNRGHKKVFIGVWRHSPVPDTMKPAVFGFIAEDGSLRRKIYSETCNGTVLPEENCPAHPRRFVHHQDVIFRADLSALTAVQIKTFVRFRGAAQHLDETAEQKMKADKLAVCEATRSVIKSRKGESRVKRIGVLLGFWKGSNAPQDDDKCAALAVYSKSRMGVRITKYTRAGKPYKGNWPEGHSAEWICYEDVVLEPELAGLTQIEVKEYVRLCELPIESKNCTTEIDHTALQKAKANIVAEAVSKGTTIARLNIRTGRCRKKLYYQRRKEAREEQKTNNPASRARRASQLLPQSLYRPLPQHSQPRFASLSANDTTCRVPPPKPRRHKAEVQIENAHLLSEQKRRKRQNRGKERRSKKVVGEEDQRHNAQVAERPCKQYSVDINPYNSHFRPDISYTPSLPQPVPAIALRLTRTEEAVRLLQDQYSERLPIGDMLSSIRVFKNDGNAQIFLELEPGARRDKWLEESIAIE